MTAVIRLDCSAELKQQRLAPIVFRKFARMFSKQSGIPEEQVLENVQFLSARCLSRGRIRGDAVANFLHPEWRRSIGKRDDAHVFLFGVSSPHCRGIDFACTVDILVGDTWARRLAPLVSLNKAQLGINGKMAAPLWQAYLLTGPAWDSLSHFCHKVCSVTMGMGTERLLAGSPSCLAALFAVAFACEPLRRQDSGGHLFGNSVLMPGFRHLADHVLQRGLTSLTGFPGFLAKIKSIVKFLRSELAMDAIRRCLERDGYPAVAAVMRKASWVSFAAWRGGPLQARRRYWGPSSAPWPTTSIQFRSRSSETQWS